MEYTTTCSKEASLYAGVICTNGKGTIMCGYELLIIHIIIIIVPITIICANKTAVDGSVRLYGGGDPAIGNVEVLYNGVWGAV